MKKNLVYVVEDERDIGDLVCRALEHHGFVAEHFTRGKPFLQRMRSRQASLCLIDLGLPDIEGLDLIRELRSRYDVAIVVLTNRSDPTDRIIGLELGADDYVVKPFEPLEVVARAKSVLRRFHRDAARTSGGSRAPRVATFAGWSFSQATQSLHTPAGIRLELSTSESDLLMVLLQTPNQILSREQLLYEKDGRDSSPFDRSIDICVSRLRRKIETDPKNPQIIKTVYGAGYIFAVDVEWEPP